MKIIYLAITSLVFNGAMAFAPQQRAFVGTDLHSSVSEEDTAAPVSVSAPEPAPKEAAIVPIKEETVEFTAGILGGAAGFVMGGPVVAAIGAAAANYVSKSTGEAGNVVSAVSKSTLQVCNYVAGLDTKYELLKKAQGSLESAVDKLKDQKAVDSAALEKVENALASTKAKITEINDEYDIVGSGVTALGVFGDLVEKTVNKVGELNEEYRLGDKAKDAMRSAVDKARGSTNL